MNSGRLRPLYLFSVLVLVLLASAVTAGAPARLPARKFDFTYRFTVPPQTKRLRIWVPLAATNRSQQARLWKVESPVSWKETFEPIYGNPLLYGEVRNPSGKPLEVAFHFRVVREERGAEPAPVGDFSRYLMPDRLVPLDARFRAMAQELTREKTSPREKARALYDYVFENMVYDKSGTGWGRGDAVYACDVRRGNCTDFHSLFIALARSVGIPARFVIGFPLPPGNTEGSVEGYHCWAEFLVEGEGWVPVDITDAWKQPARKNYFFGTLDRNRVEFTVGRDLVLSPPQQGDPLNYLIYPYAEADGLPVLALSYQFEFSDRR